MKAAVRLLAVCIALASILAGEKKPDRNVPGQAVIVGTVFREPGFAFGGAEIVMEPDPESKTSHKVKKMKALSDSRGEFSFRVPAQPMRYTLSVKAVGYGPEKRQVTISGEERQDVYFTLKPVK